nr:hypothetical protein [uncultured Psychroserpens sp.]
MKFKKLIPAAIILLLGIGANITGIMFRIQHWPYGSEILLFGTFLKLLALIVGIIALIKMYRNR